MYFLFEWTLVQKQPLRHVIIGALGILNLKSKYFEFMESYLKACKLLTSTLFKKWTSLKSFFKVSDIKGRRVIL